MQQAQGQFTPEQLIIAGRRAEAQGQPAYALQFYRYIADQFPTSTEAYEARDAIYRLHQPAADPVAPVYPAAPAASHDIAPPAPAVHATTGMTDLRPSASLDASHGPSYNTRPAATSSKRAKRSSRAAAAAVAAPPEEVDDAADFGATGYRIGRFVGVMLNTMGWFLLLGGVAMAPLIFAALTVKALPKGLREGIAANLLMVGGITFGMIFLGLFAIFAAQAARATFDTADAIRQMVYGRASDQPD